MPRDPRFRPPLLALVPALALCLGLTGCGDDDEEDAPAAPTPSASITTNSAGQTKVAPYAVALPGSGYEMVPLLTVGDNVPLLTGTYPAWSADVTKTFALTGLPDGMGLFESGGANWLWVQHEMAVGTLTDFSTDFTGQINGARLSVFKFDADWRCLGGRNLITSLRRDGTEVGSITVNAGAKTVAQTGYNLGRFCSGYLATSGFVEPSTGSAVPVWFASEEFDDGEGWACYPSGVAEAITGLGKYAKEQVLALSAYRASNSAKTVLISTEDGSALDSEIYMWVGDQTTADPNGLAAANGNLYVLKVDGADLENNADDTVVNIPNTATEATWTLIPDATATGSAAGLKTYVTTVAGDRRSTSFTRVEDVAEDPATPGTLYVLTTGGNTDNKYGRMYKLVMNTTDPTGPASIQRVLQGGGTGATGVGAGIGSQGVAYDNLVVDSKGKIVIQEDPTSPANVVLGAESRNARGISVTYTGGVPAISFIYEVNQEAIDGAGAGTGSWESSGIVEGPASLATASKAAYVINVQAHSLRIPTVSVDVLNGSHAEGGQLLLAKPSSMPTGVGWIQVPGAKPAWHVGDAQVLSRLGLIAP